MANLNEFDDFVAEKLKDPNFELEFNALEPEFSIIHAMIEARKASGLTQKQLAERVGIDQGDISKIETGDANPSLKTLKKLASGMNTRLRLEFLPIEEQQMSSM